MAPNAPIIAELAAIPGLRLLGIDRTDAIARHLPEELTYRYRAFDSIEDEPPGTAWRWYAEALEWAADPPAAPG